MNKLNTEYFARCIATLKRAFEQLQNLSSEDELYDICRAACVKEALLPQFIIDAYRINDVIKHYG